jgi:biotin synthase
MRIDLDFNNIENRHLSINNLTELLSLEIPSDIEQLFKTAYSIKLKYVGNKVYFRGLIELSNICEKDCFYCGIRKSNEIPMRYIMDEKEIIDLAMWCYKAGYGSIVLQSGEISSNSFAKFIENIIIKIKHATEGKLGITLSLGEQEESAYQRWYDAGAHRYLIRIETTNPDLYERIHPSNHDFNRRLKCIDILKKIGYYTGTGIMIGLPGQNYIDIARDIEFFRTIDVDMIGMGPYIPHKDTPMGQEMNIPFNQYSSKQLDLALKTISVTRIYLKDVNIASTTALQALDESGREKGLLAGANIIMPNITDPKYRSEYQLYDNKPCLNENAVICRDCLESRIQAIGEKIGYNEWGDSPHHNKKV